MELILFDIHFVIKENFNILRLALDICWEKKRLIRAETVVCQHEDRDHIIILEISHDSVHQTRGISVSQ